MVSELVILGPEDGIATVEAHEINGIEATLRGSIQQMVEWTVQTNKRFDKFHNTVEEIKDLLRGMILQSSEMMNNLQKMHEFVSSNKKLGNDLPKDYELPQQTQLVGSSTGELLKVVGEDTEQEELKADEIDFLQANRAYHTNADESFDEKYVYDEKYRDEGPDDDCPTDVEDRNCPMQTRLVASSKLLTMVDESDAKGKELGVDKIEAKKKEFRISVTSDVSAFFSDPCSLIICLLLERSNFFIHELKGVSFWALSEPFMEMYRGDALNPVELALPIQIYWKNVTPIKMTEQRTKDLLDSGIIDCNSTSIWFIFELRYRFPD